MQVRQKKASERDTRDLGVKTGKQTWMMIVFGKQKSNELHVKRTVSIMHEKGNAKSQKLPVFHSALFRPRSSSLPITGEVISAVGRGDLLPCPLAMTKHLSRPATFICSAIG